MKTVDDLLRELRILEIKKESVLNPGETYMNFIIDPDGFGFVENLIRDFWLDHEKTEEKEKMLYYDSKIGEMQGKIFAYEEIIKKSNFAPFVDNSELREKVVRLQNAITKYDIEKVKKELEETKETTEKETMFYSEFRKSDDWCNANFCEYFDLSGNEIDSPKKSDKILKYYKREVGDFKFLIVFIGKE